LAPLQGKDYIVSSLETGGYAKNWPKEHWQTLFNELREMGKFVVLIGQPSQSYIDINFMVYRTSQDNEINRNSQNDIKF